MTLRGALIFLKDSEQGYLKVFIENLKISWKFSKKVLRFEINEFWFYFQTPSFLEKLLWAYVREKYDVTGVIKNYFLVENISTSLKN